MNSYRIIKFSCSNNFLHRYTSYITIKDTYRQHSSISESKRQKLVLEPKIVIQKFPNKFTKGSLIEKFVTWRDRADPYIKLMRVDKPIGTWLLFWPCSWSIALASITNPVDASVATTNLALFLAGSFIMRGAGCTINDLWDRDYDGKVERTMNRPLVSGAISERKAVIFLAAQLSAGLAILLQLNWFSVALGASSMLLVVTYPLAKRFTNYPQLFLGATMNWGALLGYSAVAGDLNPVLCLPLYAGALCWTVVYDTIYAHQDKADDARIGIKSTALTFGTDTKPLLSIWGAFACAGIGAAGYSAGLSTPFYVALAVAAQHVATQIYTLDTENPSDCAYKFKSNSLVGLIIFLGIVGGGYHQYHNVRKNSNKSDLISG